MTITLNGSSGIQNVLGSAASPAESNTSSSNTGMYFPTSTTIGFSANGTNAATIAGTTIALAGGSTSATGVGIVFPATQSASSNANTLDDYKEGTWTPTAASSTGAITSYTSSGVYTKIGRIVNLQGQIQITNIGTAGGTLSVGAIPYISLYTGSSIALEANVVGYSYQFYIPAGTVTGTVLSFTNGAVYWANNVIYNLNITFTI
jgi:hypothetical protein